MDSYKAACIQMTSTDKVGDNLARAEHLLSRAAEAGALLAVLPEFFPLLSADETAKLAIAEADNDGDIQNFLARAAQKYGLYIVGGTVPISAPPAADGQARVYASSLLYAPDGSRLARYDKMHLFQFRGDQQQYDETRTICAGENKAVAVDCPLGRIGLSVCYDLRFPELYRRMEQPDIIVAPSAFTRETGKAHWRLLLTARAVENLAYVVGAAQSGTHAGGRQTYGNSMIISPWGETLACAQDDGEAVIISEINAAEREHWRKRLPVLANRRIR